MAKYSYELKKECIELYRQGKWKETPKGTKQAVFRKHIMSWDRLVKSHGEEILKHKNKNKVWSAEEKFNLISKGVSHKLFKAKSILYIYSQISKSQANLFISINSAQRKYIFIE